MSALAYGFGIATDLSMEEADQRLREALAGEGFGILTEIDVAATLKAKLGVEWPPYRILGACNPHLAHQALVAEQSVGLLLPCNVVLRRNGDVTIVEVLEPAMMAEVTANPALEPIAIEARLRLQRALEAFSTT
ncbi:MAG TPA: DUF302 domain-containing protein [Acidimicrobiia bacterium]|nr:DUF302 domain-containing protein [Acidimicrobiia bacterium]